MAKRAKKKLRRTAARRLKGFRDITAAQVSARDWMIAKVRQVYEAYGFVPLETPALEYVDVLGKFLPEADRPDAGIFALQDENDEWVALRYDLTAPLSRFVAANINELPTPYRRYQVGPVWRVEKPGPGRFREFYQCDFDTVGTASMIADAEACCVMADTLEALDISPGDYIVRVNDRKVLSGVLERIGGDRPLDYTVSLNILRSIDKLDRVGPEGVGQLLGKGRKDESGAFVQGVGLEPDRIEKILDYLRSRRDSRGAVCDKMERLVQGSEIGTEGVSELRQIDQFLRDAGYDESRVVIDPTVVRGLEYYTGPVFEADLTFKITDDGALRQSGTAARQGSSSPSPVGSVFSGGRYDGLVKRFLGRQIPATGASIGVDRLLAALTHIGKIDTAQATAGVMVTRLDKTMTAQYQQIAADLRRAGVNTELYVGTQNIGKQFKYAGDSGKIAVVVMGSDEAERGEVSVKDLRLGDELSKEIGEDRKKWLEQQPAQISVPRDKIVDAVREILARYIG